MDSALVKNAAEPRSVDPVWSRIREAAQAAAVAEPVLAGTLHATILSQPKFEAALSYHLARLCRKWASVLRPCSHSQCATRDVCSA